MSLSPVAERAHMIRKLMEVGVKASPLPIDQVRDLYKQHFDAPAPEAKPEPKPEPKPEAKPKAVKSPTLATTNNSELAARMAELLSAFGSGSSMDESRVIELIKEHSQSRTITIDNKVRDIEVNIEQSHKSFARVLGTLQCGLNAYLCGPAGTGKTTLARQCAEALGLEFYFTGAVLQKYELLGFIDAGGNYQTTDFRRAFEFGGVFLFDEMDASAAQALVAFNAAIANGVCSFPDKTIEAHPDFLVIAASNTNGQGATDQYLRNKLDAATLDRYVFINVEYDADLELELARQYGEVGEQWAQHVQKLRTLASVHGVNEVITPRATLQGCKLLASGNFSFQMVEYMCIYNKMSPDNAETLRAAI